VAEIGSLLLTADIWIIRDIIVSKASFFECFFIVIIRLSAKGTDGVMKRGDFRLLVLSVLFLFRSVGTLQNTWR
jgi:hypothetical protein